MAAVRAAVVLHTRDPETGRYTTLVPNPSLSANVTYWGALGGVLSWVNGPGRDGVNGYGRVVKSAAAGDLILFNQVSKSRVSAGLSPIQPGTYRATMSVRNASATARDGFVVLQFFDAGGALIDVKDGPIVRLAPGFWVDLPDVTGVATPATAADVRLAVYVRGAIDGETFDFDLAYMSPPRAPSDDISCWVDSVTVKHGRDDYQAAVSPAACTVNLKATTADQISPLLVVGTWLKVTVPDPMTGNALGRFVGKISDITWTWDDAGEQTPTRASAQVIAASRLADATRGDEAAYAPTTPNREVGTLGQLMTAAGNPVYFEPIGTPAEIAAGGANTVVAALAAGWNLLDALTTMGQETGALVLENPDTGAGQYVLHGLVSTSWFGAPARVLVILDSCDLRAGVSWDLVYDVLNSLLVKSPAQPDTLVENDKSKALFGTWGDTWTSRINSPGDLGSRISFFSQYRNYPQWQTDALDIATRDLTPGKYSILLRARVLDAFRITNMPAFTGTPAEDVVRIEGWEETFSATETEPVHEWRINVTAGLLVIGSGIPPGPKQNRWTDGTKTWAAIPAAQTWWDSWQAGKV